MAADEGTGRPDGRPVDEDGKLVISLTVNQRVHRVRARPHHSLLDVLRSELKLTGSREGCGIGMCGACTVLLDGAPVSACLLLAVLAEGHQITTIEGLAPVGGELHPVQRAYVECTGFQCSYCTPGFILATTALLDENPDPSVDEAKEYLAGNLCRCGSYVKILDSVMAAKRLGRTPGGRADAGGGPTAGE